MVNEPEVLGKTPPVNTENGLVRLWPSQSAVAFVVLAVKLRVTVVYRHRVAGV